MAAIRRFSVLQFNTLADSLHDSFPLVSKQFLQWDHRKTRIISEILRNDPDFVCLEEVEHFEDWFLPQLRDHGYEGMFLSKTSGNTDGCAMFYRVAKFALYKRTHLKYCDHLPDHPKQVALIAEFTSTTADSVGHTCVAVTHLKAGSQFESVRLQEAAVIARHLAQLRQQTPGLPIVLAGDLNTEPSGPVYSLLTKGSGKLDQIIESYPSGELPLSSAYSTYRTEGEPLYTTWKIRPPHELCRVIDYLFFSSDVLKVSNLRRLPTPEEIPHPHLPSESLPSDHLPLQATFETIV